MTFVENILISELEEIKKGGYVFAGAGAKDLTHDELLIAYKVAVDKMNINGNRLVKWFNDNPKRIEKMSFSEIVEEINASLNQ